MSNRAICALLLVLTSGAQAQTAVELVHTGTDGLGRTLAYEVRELLASSKTLQLWQGGDPYAWRLVIHLNTLETVQGSAHQGQTAYSMAALLPATRAKALPEYIRSEVGICGSARIADCSKQVLGSISATAELIEQARKAAGR